MKTFQLTVSPEFMRDWLRSQLSGRVEIELVADGANGSKVTTRVSIPVADRADLETALRAMEKR